VAVGQQRQRTAAADRLEQAYVKLLPQRLEQPAKLRDREPLTPQLRKHEQLEQIDRRVTPLGVPAALGFFRRNV